MSEPVVVFEDEHVRLWHGDCRLWMLGHAPAAAAIVTDPPYGDTSLERCQAAIVRLAQNDLFAGTHG